MNGAHLLLVGPILIVGWQILTWLQSSFWPSLPLVTAVEGPGIQVMLPGESPAAFRASLIRTIVAPAIAIAIIATAVAFGFVARAVML